MRYPTQHLPVLLLLPLLIGLLWTGCTPDDDGGGPTNSCTSALPQAELLAAVADGQIIPTYAELLTRTEALHEAAAALAAAPTAVTLATARTAFVDAYTNWQAADRFQFGPAEEELMRPSFNNFPVDAAALEARIANGNLDFGRSDSYDRGLPAVDYLLYQGADTAATLDYLTATPNALDFLVAVTADLERRAASVLDGWTAGYRNAFVANTGTAAGSGLSLLINQLNQHYENLKRDKLGLPAGVLTIGIANPTKVEAYYSGISLSLAEAALLASQRLYTGGEGSGLGDYLTRMPNEDAEDVHADIEARYAEALRALTALDGELSALVQDDQAAVTAAYAEVTRQVVHLKTDLPALTCVSITYIDNPSDSD